MSNSKVNFYSKIQSQIWLASDFFCSNSLPGLNHRLSFYCILALPRFSTSRPHCILGNSQKFFILSLQPLRPTTQILRLPCFSVVANSKICRGRSRNSSAVESQSYFVSRRPFQHVHEQQAKFANEVHHLTRFLEKVDS